MGSLIMHYCIASELLKKLHVDSNRFLVGGIAPDVPQMNNESKSQSHFRKRHENGIIYYDYNAFFEKYKHRFNDAFYLGYLTHLISDDIWLHKVVYKYLNPLPPQERIIANKKYYSDFWKLNKILIKHYGIEATVYSFEDVESQEFNPGLITSVVERLYKDFQDSPETIEEPLAILKENEVLEYIKEAVEKSYNELIKVYRMM